MRSKPENAYFIGVSEHFNNRSRKSDTPFDTLL